MSSTLPTDYWARVVYLVTHYSASFLRGAGSTLLIALVGTFVGCLIGFAVGIVQTIPVSKQDSIIKRALLFIVKLILNIYVEVFRGTPMIVQAMFIYFGAMQYLGITMGMWFAAFFIVSINTGAYMAETVRGGILSIDPGQTEGAKAIGMTHFQTMLYVIFPQTLRNIIPQIGNNLIINIKDSSVLSVIGVIELYYAAKQTAGAYYWWFEYIRGLGEMKQPVPSYPDANFTMRLTYGNVKSYSPRDAVHYDYYTTTDGILEKENPEDREFVVPAKLKELIQKKDFGRYAMADGTMPVCFLTTNDITGGNSGSPVINGEGQLIGCAFDGNWESLSGDINFDNNLQRCIALDIRYVLFILDKLGNCGHLIKEMNIIE